MAILGDRKVCRVQHLVRKLNPILGRFEFADKFAEKLGMRSNSQSLYVLKNTEFWLKLANEAHEVKNERISRVVQCSFPNHRKALARWASENDVNIPSVQSGLRADLVAGKIGDAGAYRNAVREVEFVRCTMNRIDLDGRRHIESRLLEAKRKPPCTREDVDSGWAISSCS